MLMIGPVCADGVPESSHLTVKRGLTSQLVFSHPSPTLQAIPDQSVESEILIRLERMDLVQREFRYKLWFFGTVAGDYDLSHFVVESDGSPVPASAALPRMLATVVSDLPPGYGTNLYEIDDPTLQAPGGYRAALISFAVLWAAVPIIWGFVRWRSRQPVHEESIVQPPTLSDRLRPLVQRASEGLLSVEEQSRLELLIYVFWQRRLSLPESLVDALPVMRRHSEAGGLLRSIEAWIHEDHSSRRSPDPAEMEALLAPYRTSEVEGDLPVQPIAIGGTA